MAKRKIIWNVIRSYIICKLGHDQKYKQKMRYKNKSVHKKRFDIKKIFFSPRSELKKRF